MKVNGIDQNKVTIENILYKNVNVGIVANADLSFSHQTLELKGTWTGIEQYSQVVYGITLNHLLSEAAQCFAQYVLFRPAYCDIYKLIEVSTGHEIKYFHDVNVSKDIDDNYSEFDGIRFQLV